MECYSFLFFFFQVVHGDTTKDANEIYPLRINTIREIIEEPTKLRGRRTEASHAMAQPQLNPFILFSDAL